MGNILLVSRQSLQYIVRTPFFWVWNGAVLLVSLALNHLTFFDFEGGGLVWELFFTTLGLSGAVNSAAFYLQTSSERSQGQLDLLLTRPVRTPQLVLGQWIAIMSVQIVISIIFVGAHVLESRGLRRPISPFLAQSWTVSILQIGMLSGLYGLIALEFKDFWALALMLGGFVVGHLSGNIHLALPHRLSLLADGLFCLVPDLELYRPASGGGGGAHSALVAGWNGVYVGLYCLTALLLSSASLKRWGRIP
jgi:ABC-type transport system involved in multi-copper enzyme maturation permease subunit